MPENSEEIPTGTRTYGKLLAPRIMKHMEKEMVPHSQRENNHEKHANATKTNENRKRKINETMGASKSERSLK